MISTATITALEERGLDYVLGARERTDRLVRRVVLEDTRPFAPLCVPRLTGETQLWVKEVLVAGRRYVVCRNEAGVPASELAGWEAGANRDAADRKAVLEGLERQLQKGDKALIGNSAYRRFLKATTKKAFTIALGRLLAPALSETEPPLLLRLVADEARFDGIFILRTNARISPLQAVLRDRDLLPRRGLLTSAPPVREPLPAGCGWSRICFGQLTRSCAPGRSTTPPTPPSAAMCSARSWRWSSRRSSTIAARLPTSAPSGAMCGATSIVSRRSRSRRTASA